MDQFIIRGGARLSGTIEISGSKNSALPIMAACLMADGPSVLNRVPRLRDTDSMSNLLRDLGCSVERASAPGRIGIGDSQLLINIESESPCEASLDIVKTMRAGICVLGPLLARRGRAVVPMPGGCDFGSRPIDLHLRGLAKLGAKFHMEEGNVIGEVKGRLRGTTLYLGGSFGPTVLGTINVMTAATLAEGTTRIIGAASEPEVVDCADLLNKMGARIIGAGTGEITIEGVDKLHGTTHTVIPDRIETGTFLVAAGITGGDLTLTHANVDHLIACVDRLEDIGLLIRVEGSTVRVRSAGRPRHTEVTTWPYPGVPTDLQAQLMALLTIGDGKSLITERVYPDRFKHADELTLMGAQIRRSGNECLVDGVEHLTGATVTASDLRASAALVLAGLAATGTTKIEKVHHIDRGYERIEEKLAGVGADIERVVAKPHLAVTVSDAVADAKKPGPSQSSVA
jgi:UDP-N-acetylglucosamine 1-carboxyvinyltransferase